jgi:hypothetical protein
MPYLDKALKPSDYKLNVLSCLEPLERKILDIFDPDPNDLAVSE